MELTIDEEIYKDVAVVILTTLCNSIHSHSLTQVRTLSVGEDETNCVIVAWRGLTSSTPSFHIQGIEEKLMYAAVEAGMTMEEAQGLSGILQRLRL